MGATTTSGYGWFARAGVYEGWLATISSIAELRPMCPASKRCGTHLRDRIFTSVVSLGPPNDAGRQVRQCVGRQSLGLALLVARCSSDRDEAFALFVDDLHRRVCAHDPPRRREAQRFGEQEPSEPERVTALNEPRCGPPHLT